MIIDGDRCLEDVIILDVGNKYGPMTTAASFYPMKMTLEKRQSSFLKKRKQMSEVNDFNYQKFFSAKQILQDGSYCVLTPELINKKEDGWLLNIPEDILIITKETPGVVVGHPIADWPVVIMVDKKHGATAVGYCSNEMVDQGLPVNIFLALEKEFGTKKDDVKIFVSSCISEKCKYNDYPNFINNEGMWIDAIKKVYLPKKNSYYTLDIRKAILTQILGIGIPIENIYWNMDDTLMDSNYYSMIGSKKDKSKNGRNFAGAYYPLKEETAVLIKKL